MRYQRRRACVIAVLRYGLLVLLTACNEVGCTVDPESPRDVNCLPTAIAISPNSVRMPPFATASLNVTVALPSRAGSACGTVLVGWTSADPQVASIGTQSAQQAEIIGVAAGTARITASVTVPTLDGDRTKSATADVTIVPLVPSLKLSASALTITIPQTGSVTARVVDQDNRDLTSRATITWSTDPRQPSATVDRTTGVITAVAPGVTTVTATAVVGGLTTSQTVQVTVQNPPVQPVSTLKLTGPTSVRISERILLEAEARDANGALVSDPALSWQANPPNIGTVTATQANNLAANVLGIAVGKVTITATAASGKTASVDVNVAPGPVASVVVTPSANTIRQSKTLQLTAVAKDASGNTIPDQLFTWSSAATDLATVNSSGFVTAIAAGKPAIRATVAGTSVTGSVDVNVLARRVGYALANQPQAASYAASAATSFNSAGGSIAITRVGVGSYTVSFPDQARLAGEVETVSVSSYGSNAYCKLAGWVFVTTNLVAAVRCFAFGGSPGDAQFTISFVSDGSLGNRFGFAYADQASAASAYTPTESFNNSASQPAPQIQVSHTGVGKYSVKFTGNGGGVLDPEGVVVTAVGQENERCQPGSELTGETIAVNCWTGAVAEYESIPADSRFTIVLADRGRGSPERAGFAFVDDAVVTSNGGSLTLPSFAGYTSTATAVRVNRRSNGVYDVTFTGLATGVSGGRFVAHVSDMDNDDSAYCSVTTWSTVGADLVVTVTCWHEGDGTPDDDTFYLFVIQ